jgi:hypothetical protein
MKKIVTCTKSLYGRKTYMKIIHLIPLISLAFFSCTENQVQPTFNKTQLTVKKMSPAPESYISDSGIIEATLEYKVAEESRSSLGYNILIAFEPADGNGFSCTQDEIFHLINDEGTYTLKYPISNLNGWTNLKSPLTCYFVLERLTGDGTNGNLCYTSKFNFQYNKNSE